jgi:hypothetical protein
MALIHQTIPERHVDSFLDNGHYFTPCRVFPDRMEFRYGYCLFNYDITSEEDIDKCVQRTLKDGNINRRIDSACVSCWVSELMDEPQMWKVHGKAGPAIRISVNCDHFCRHAEAQGYHIAHYPITYEGFASGIRPPFGVRRRLTETEDESHHLFFHKRDHFRWEHEYRVILFASEALTIPLVV